MDRFATGIVLHQVQGVGDRYAGFQLGLVTQLGVGGDQVHHANEAFTLDRGLDSSQADEGVGFVEGLAEVAAFATGDGFHDGVQHLGHVGSVQGFQQAKHGGHVVGGSCDGFVVGLTGNYGLGKGLDVSDTDVHTRRVGRGITLLGEKIGRGGVEFSNQLLSNGRLNSCTRNIYLNFGSRLLGNGGGVFFSRHDISLVQMGVEVEMGNGQFSTVH